MIRGCLANRQARHAHRLESALRSPGATLCLTFALQYGCMTVCTIATEPAYVARQYEIRAIPASIADWKLPHVIRSDKHPTFAARAVSG